MNKQSELLEGISDQLDSLVDMMKEQKSQEEKVDKLVENVVLLKYSEPTLMRAYIDLLDYLKIRGVSLSPTKLDKLREWLLNRCLEHDAATSVLHLQRYDMYPLGLLNYVSVSDPWSIYFEKATV